VEEDMSSQHSMNVDGRDAVALGQRLDNRPGDPIAASASSHVAADPCFAIECKRGSLVCHPGRRVPGGTRLHVVFEGGTVTPLPGSAVDGLSGEVLSGADWLLVRDDGVAIFDGRLTLGKSARDVVTNVDLPADKEFEEGRLSTEAFLVNAVVSGRAELALPRENGRVNYRDWLRFTGVIPVAVPISFEAGQAANWAKPRFRQLGDNFKKYEILLQRQCLALGEIAVAEGQIVAVRYDVWALRPGRRAERSA
jgi:hypothetical protein